MVYVSTHTRPPLVRRSATVLFSKSPCASHAMSPSSTVRTSRSS